MVVTGLLVACGGSVPVETTSQLTPGTTSSGIATGAATSVVATRTTAAAATTTAPTATAMATAIAAPTQTPEGPPPTATAEPPVKLGKGGPQIVVWHNWSGDYGKAVEKILSDYAIKNNVTVVLLKVSDLANKVQKAVPAGEGPDVIAWVDDLIGKSALNNVIQPLDQLGVTPAYLNQNFSDVASSAVTFNKKVYGIPESEEALTFIYNKKLINEKDLPKSTDDLLTKAKNYNGPNKYLFVYNSKNDAYFSAPWWQGSGVTLVTAEGTTDVGNDKSVKAGYLLKSLSQIMPKDLDYNAADALFKAGNAAIIMNGPWSVADYQKRGIDIGLAKIPVVNSSGQPGKPFVGVRLLMLAQKSKQAKAAVDLMKFYGTAPVQVELAKVNKQVPANKQAKEQLKSDPIISGFTAQAAQGTPLPNNQYVDVMWDPVSKTVGSIWSGAATPEQAVKDGAALFKQRVKELK
ncbi:MAG: extracellular solute-binding protein [Herpetosiphon sp.]